MNNMFNNIINKLNIGKFKNTFKSINNINMRTVNHKMKNKKNIIIIIFSIAFCLTTALATMVIIKQTSLVSQASCDEEAKRVQNLIPLVDKDKPYTCRPMATSDFVQPWLFDNYSNKDIYDYVKILKNAGYKNIILQNIATTSGGEKNDAHFTSMWYQTSVLKDISTLDVYKPQVLSTLFEAAKKYNMGIYVGLAMSNDWYNNSFTNHTWRYNNAALINKLVKDIYYQYGNNPCFKGYYWGFEMFTNDVGYEQNWSEMLNYTINYINKLEGNKKSHPIIISPYYSDDYKMNSEDIYDFYTSLIDNTNFRSNDIICVQDCLTTTNISPKKILEYINKTKKAIYDSSNNLNFWINVENYRDITTTPKSADLVRYKLQLDICSKYADNLASFSYSHYYNPTIVDSSYDEDYRKYINNTALKYKISNKNNTTKTKFSIADVSTNSNNNDHDTTSNRVTNTNISDKITGYQATTFDENNIQQPKGGYIYTDKNDNKAPIPAGFKVNKKANIISEGLVIQDKYGNEFVWVPINGGIRHKDYSYSSTEHNIVYYARYLKKGIKPENTETDTLPKGINSELTQIEKYHGFYIGRYETSFNYNNGQPTASIKETSANSIDENFEWRYTNSSTYTGYTWNNITYKDAKSISENMCNKYNYKSTVHTALINGTQWDTVYRWCKITSTLDNSIQNNIYNLNGVLSEWTNEKSLIGYVIRGNNYLQNNQLFDSSYGKSSEDISSPKIGFRIVLYIE